MDNNLKGGFVLKEKDAKLFYRTQFDMMKDLLEDQMTVLESDVQELLEQVGKPFTNVLELGSGVGHLAHQLAEKNKSVTAIELVPELAEFAKKHTSKSIHYICDSFYTVDLQEKFDLIIYIDGFGVGEDEDQLTLLSRINQWLTDDGVALIDIYNPFYWQKIAGQQMTPFGDDAVERLYDYDFANDRMIDSWWYKDKPAKRYKQSLACYQLDEIYHLCKEAGLKIVSYFPGGAMDYKNWQYIDKTSLTDCFSYRIKIVKNH